MLSLDTLKFPLMLICQDVRNPSATQMCSLPPADVTAVLGAAACKCSFLFPVIQWHMGLSQTW